MPRAAIPPLKRRDRFLEIFEVLTKISLIKVADIFHDDSNDDVHIVTGFSLAFFGVEQCSIQHTKFG
jgi:hypothetical protein